MLTIYSCFRSVILIFIMSLVTVSEAADINIHTAENDLLGSWIVDIEGESRTRTLNIHGLDKGQTGVSALDATYGMTDQGQGSVKADVTIKRDGYTLRLTTQPGSLIVAEFSSDGLFTGIFTSPKGKVSPIRLKKMSADEVSKRPALPIWRREQAKFKQPTADVPASCAGFVGGWTGRWPRYGSTWLWVIEIDANCIATYAHRGGPNFPGASVLKKVEITKGILSSPDGQGAIDSFELHGDELWARHSAADGINNTVFWRVPIEAQ